jgi:hypothetical protein
VSEVADRDGSCLKIVGHVLRLSGRSRIADLLRI